jgi:hypothetical protein
MSNAHAQQYYFGAGTETSAGSGAIDSYDLVMDEPSALSDPTVETQAPQPGLNAPISQDKRRGSS